MLLKKVQVHSATEHVVCIKIYIQYDYGHISFGKCHVAYMQIYASYMYVHTSFKTA